MIFNLILSLLLIIIILYYFIVYHSKELIISFWCGKDHRLGIYFHNKKALKRHFVKQYCAGYKYIINIFLFKLRIGVTLK